MSPEGRFRSGEIDLVLFEPILGYRQIGLGLIHHDLIGARIDIRAELARFHFHVGVAIERPNRAGHASGEGRGRRGTDDATRGHDPDDRAAFNLLRDVMRRCASIQGPGEKAASESQKNDPGERRHAPT
jgi:hypothetical protein